MQSQDEESENDLFRRAMHDVRPLKRAPRALVRKRTEPKARFARQERVAVLSESLLPPGSVTEVQGGDEMQFQRPGVAESVVRGLRRGRYRLDAELDLHGLNAAAAERELSRFVQYARSERMRCVRIIHGKGLRSGQRGPVLKNAVNAQLQRIDAVLAFASARAVDGGTGATLVLLALAHPRQR